MVCVTAPAGSRPWFMVPDASEIHLGRQPCDDQRSAEGRPLGGRQVLEVGLGQAAHFHPDVVSRAQLRSFGNELLRHGCNVFGSCDHRQINGVAKCVSPLGCRAEQPNRPGRRR